jgi:MoxR-like ATPase
MNLFKKVSTMSKSTKSKKETIDGVKVSRSRIPAMEWKTETISEPLMEAVFAVAKELEEVQEAKEVRKEDGERPVTGYINMNGYMLNEGMYKVMVRNVQAGTNTLLLGPTGAGKTELVDAIAKHLDLPLTIIDMGTMTDPIVSLVGSHTISVQDGVTRSEFKRSRFSEIIQRPGIVLLDELSRASAQANNLLFPVLDFRKELAMEYDFEDNTPVKVHPDCVFIATANLGSEYTGASKLDRALVDRFMLLQVKELPSNVVSFIMANLFPEIENDELKSIIDTYVQINTGFKAYDNQASFSLRHLKNVCELVQDGFTPYDSFYMIYDGLAPDVEKVQNSIFNAIKK